MPTPLEMIQAAINPKGEKQRKRNMQKRHQRFREIEEALPESQRLMNRTDFGKHVTAFKCPTCGMYQESKNALDHHVSSCKKEASLSEAEKDHPTYSTRQIAIRCDWVLDLEGKRCGKIFDDEVKLMTHHAMQHTSKDSKETCKDGAMKQNSLQQPIKEHATYITDGLTSTKPTPKRLLVRGKAFEAVKAAANSAESASVDSADKEEDSDDEPLVLKKRRVL